MSCPSCGYALQKLTVTTDAGGKFDIDHCGRCGGTWFDPYEINRIPYHEISRIAHLTVLPKNTPLFAESRRALFTENLLCPRCHKILAEYSGESVPHGVTLFRCPKCHGIWATQKALASFKREQDARVKEYKARKSAFPALSVVFMPTLFVLLLFVATYITVTNLSKSRQERVQAAAQITQLQTVSLSPTKEIVTFKTKSPLASQIAYGVSSFDMTQAEISKTPKTEHSIILIDLLPDTYYLFQITLIDESGRKITASLATFKTGN
jgi:Zn-finger nucleic acid-binding protein